VGQLVAFSLVGQDQPGIVHQVTAVLSGLGANIEALDTRLSVEPHSGAPLFHLDARLRLPPPLQAEAVKTALEDISAEIMVDISLTPAE
jgi:glycine cleavage system regulatory protein